MKCTNYTETNIQKQMYKLNREYKLERYKIRDVQTGDVQKLEMYNQSGTGCTNYTEPNVQKKVC